MDKIEIFAEDVVCSLLAQRAGCSLLYIVWMFINEFHLYYTFDVYQTLQIVIHRCMLLCTFVHIFFQMRHESICCLMSVLCLA